MKIERPYVKALITSKAEKAVKNGHPWVYGEEIVSLSSDVQDGSIVDVEVVRSSGETSLDKEAVRVIKSMPKWSPGQQRNKPVRTRFNLPVSFKLQ